MANEKEIKEMYSRRARYYNFFCVHLSGRKRMIKSYLKKDATEFITSNAKVLDAGCGTGTATRALYEVAKAKKITINTPIHAFDLTPAMLSIFIKWKWQQEYKAIEIRQINVLEPEYFPLHWTNYDGIISAGMLEHLPRNQFVLALCNLRRRLKRDGKILVFICRKNLLTKTLRHYFEKRWKYNAYSDEELRQIFSEAGFSEIKTTKANFGWIAVVEARRSDNF